MRRDRSPALGAVISRKVREVAALYATPMWVHNSSSVGDVRETGFVGLGGRLRVRPSVYVIAEAGSNHNGSLEQALRLIEQHRPDLALLDEGRQLGQPLLRGLGAQLNRAEQARPRGREPGPPEPAPPGCSACGTRGTWASGQTQMSLSTPRIRISPRCSPRLAM